MYGVFDNWTGGANLPPPSAIPTGTISFGGGAEYDAACHVHEVQLFLEGADVSRSAMEKLVLETMHRWDSVP